MTEKTTEKKEFKRKKRYRPRRKPSNNKSTQQVTQSPDQNPDPQKKQSANDSKKQFQSINKNKKYNSSQNRPRRHKNQSNKKRSKWNRYRISEHFMKRDFDSRKKDCGECKNSLRISLGLVGVIESLRSKLNKRIEIVTGFYCQHCRSKQYGVKRDFHHMGLAADIKVEDMDPVELFKVAELYPEIKGIGLNLDEHYVHIDTRKSDDRELWIETNNELIPLTEENRLDYISDTPINFEADDPIIQSNKLPDSTPEPLPNITGVDYSSEEPTTTNDDGL